MDVLGALAHLQRNYNSSSISVIELSLSCWHHGEPKARTEKGMVSCASQRLLCGHACHECRGCICGRVAKLDAGANLIELRDAGSMVGERVSSQIWRTIRWFVLLWSTRRAVLLKERLARRGRRGSSNGHLHSAKQRGEEWSAKHGAGPRHLSPIPIPRSKTCRFSDNGNSLHISNLPHDFCTEK